MDHCTENFAVLTWTMLAKNIPDTVCALAGFGGAFWLLELEENIAIVELGLGDRKSVV